MWDHETIMMIVQGVGETLYMTVLSTVLGYLFGLPMGVLLAVSDKEGLKPNAVLYKILDAIANIVRSIPFLILLILLIPFTRAVVGKSYGSTATILGYSAMSGAVGGGGLGDIAIRYGYYRYQSDIMIVTVILLVVLVQIFQSVGMMIANKIDRRK